MTSPTHMLKRLTHTLTVAASAAALAAAAAAGAASIGSDPGLIAAKLGSPDPQDAAIAWRASSHELVPTVLGSPDPRDTNGNP